MIDFDELEKDSELWKRSQDKIIEEKIIKQIIDEDFKFPIIDKPLQNQDKFGFLYEDNKTYPNLIEFLAFKLNKSIPIIINHCSIGPGEIVVTEDKEENVIEQINRATKTIINSIVNKNQH